MFRSVAFLGSVVACVLLLTGCGGTKAIKTDMVTGKVTLDGSPLAGASVSFTPVQGGTGNAAYAITDADGKYTLQTMLGKPDAGTTPGDYIVTIVKSENVPTGQKETSPEGEVRDIMKSKLITHENYSDIKKTPFKKTTVVSGKNEFDFPLKSDGT